MRTHEGRVLQSFTGGTSTWASKSSTAPSADDDGIVREMVRERLLMEELTGSDKSEIARIVRKEIDKDRAKQKKSEYIKNIALLQYFHNMLY